MSRRNKRVLCYTAGALVLCFTVIIGVSVQRQKLEPILERTHQKYSGEETQRDWGYRIYIMNIPFGSFRLTEESIIYEGRHARKICFYLRSPALLRAVSFDNIGLNLTTVMDAQDLLPYYFEQSDVYSAKKGKSPKRIVYHHDALWMERKGYKEDIWDDTRDVVSMISWLMSQEYSDEKFLKTTMNINRTIYLVAGKTREMDLPRKQLPQERVVQVRLKIFQLDKTFNKSGEWGATVYLMKAGQRYLPLFFRANKGFIRISGVLM